MIRDMSVLCKKVMKTNLGLVIVHRVALMFSVVRRDHDVSCRSPKAASNTYCVGRYGVHDSDMHARTILLSRRCWESIAMACEGAEKENCGIVFWTNGIHSLKDVLGLLQHFRGLWTRVGTGKKVLYWVVVGDCSCNRVW